MKHQTQFRPELVDPSAFIAAGAILVGEVYLAAESSVWFNSVLRGDTERVSIGPGSNVQDGCILHADPGFPCEIGSCVSLGHGAVVHGAKVEDNSLIGIRSVILNGATVGSECLIAAGAILLEGQTIPPRSLVVGVPGKVLREISDAQAARLRETAQHYIQAGREYMQAGK